MSACNETEAHMIVGFFNYLVLNDENPANITVLTFYNGQRKLIHRLLRRHPDLDGFAFNVVTVDSYQGEENDIVLLSLVRSNWNGNIGFLKNQNRVCVAMSRAKRGFYMFGNGELLATENDTWLQIMEILSGQMESSDITAPKVRVGYRMPIVCERHQHRSWIRGKLRMARLTEDSILIVLQHHRTGKSISGVDALRFAKDLFPADMLAS
jgi:helicase required for RNAi-mediated heterochromatin assembly 1